MLTVTAPDLAIDVLAVADMETGSDITWATWQGICEATRRTSPAALTRILQRDIRNDQTQDIMDYAITLLWGDEASENDRYNELKPGSDEFFALLQTPNVSAASPDKQDRERKCEANVASRSWVPYTC